MRTYIGIDDVPSLISLAGAVLYIVAVIVVEMQQRGNLAGVVVFVLVVIVGGYLKTVSPQNQRFSSLENNTELTDGHDLFFVVVFKNTVMLTGFD